MKCGNNQKLWIQHLGPSRYLVSTMLCANLVIHTFTLVKPETVIPIGSMPHGSYVTQRPGVWLLLLFVWMCLGHTCECTLIHTCRDY